ncbi:hypothetical protein BJ875DRAFT_195392 [Amylocarpus encephaloides]|uniref:Secreted protein n=1 Tax=Amylocarpus encephaloides TaxID=45428 RepID=A0A9P7YNJ8_9HELO|nr:hypothetical protein BJ875DRAFT_195392 [Amylocarpus encephaloides]
MVMVGMIVLVNIWYPMSCVSSVLALGCDSCRGSFGGFLLVEMTSRYARKGDGWETESLGPWFVRLRTNFVFMRFVY